MKKLYVVDVSSLFFRAFYAIRPLTAPSGLPTNAIYGFLTMILRLLKEEKPDYLVFCYDRKEPSFRKDIYPEYKANRSEIPEDLAPQIPYIKKLADVLGVPSLEQNGFEADDLIGTLCNYGSKHDIHVYIVSGDKDFGQIVGPKVTLYDTMKEVKYDPAGVKEKWGVSPAQFIDYLALVGDSSDNIPGVSGIGPKGAIKLIEEFGDLDGVYEGLDKIKSASLREKLEKGKADAYLSKKLVTIVTDVDVPQDLAHYQLKGFHRPELHALLTELDFRSIEKTIDSLDTHLNNKQSSAPGPASEVAPQVAFEAAPAASTIPIVTMGVEQLAEYLKEGALLWGIVSPTGLLLSHEQDVLSYSGDPSQLGPLTDRLKIQWKGYDLKALWHFIEAKNPIASWDSMLAAYLLKPGESMEFDRVYSRYTGHLPLELPSLSDVITAHWALEHELRRKTKEVSGEQILQEIDFPLAAILLQMEQRGVRLDGHLLAEQSKELAKELQGLESDIFRLSGEHFNIGSPKQLSHVLFEKLNLPVGKKTKTGYSTDSDVLEKLKDKHPMIEKILVYREVAKLKSTYVDALPLLVKADGRIHSHFNQALTSTGRLSSTDPNLQNIPIRTERGTRIRRAFIADNGKSLLSIDYSQIELRILAHYCEDPNLLRAFQDDLDIHAATAAEVFGVSLTEVTSEMRRTAKAVNFGIAYGQGAFGLAETLGISRSESSEIIKKYFEKFRGVKTYIEDTIRTAKAKGYVETLCGRRRYMDELLSKNVAIQKFGERAAINAPIQGTASDIVKKAMLEVKRHVPCDLILQVHDELIFEGSESDLNHMTPKIISIMENVEKLKVPLKVNYAVGPNWDEAH